MEKLKISIIKPFGPTIAKVTIPEDMILKLNNYIDEIIKDEEKIQKAFKIMEKILLVMLLKNLY